MNIKIGWWAIPLLLTIAMLCMVFRPYQRTGDWDFGPIHRVLWFIPMALVWTAYFAILYLTK